MSTNDDERWGTQVLGAAGPPVADWAGIRARLGERALVEDAFDVAVQEHESPWGPLLIGATRLGVVRVALPAEEPDAVLGQLAARVSPRLLRGPRGTITQAREQLDEYFGGARQAFDVPLDWALTAGFRRQVLEATALIPYGSTASYGQVAVGAGSPKAVRAAGTALATNPLPLLVPCHRVLRSDGAVGQYLGGVPMKTALLELEAAS